MICNLCGTENKDGSKFCKNCGQNLEQAEKKEWEMDAPSGQSVTMDQTTGESQNQTAGSGVDSNMGHGGRQMMMTGRSNTIRQSTALNLRDRRGRAIQPPV